MSLYLGSNVISGTATNTKSNAHSLLDFKWSDHILNEMSWLRADTFSWQSGDVYVAAYEHLTTDYNNGTSKSETIGSYTINYVEAPDGHKITTDETNVINIYNTIGVAWYYILDTTNQRFKLPRTKFGFEGLRDSVGKYIQAGLPNITGSTKSEVNFTKNPVGALNVSDSYGYSFSVTSGNQYSLYRKLEFDASNSNSIYGNSTTVQPPATQMYLYFYVGEFSQSATEQTAGITTTQLNAKADLDLGNLNSSGKAKLGPTVYNASGNILNSDGDNLTGYGIATVYLFKNGIAEVHFNLKITTSGTNGSLFSCGINRDLLRTRNSNIPVITPQYGGSLTYYATDGHVSDDRMGYGGTFSTLNQFWQAARVYQTDGAIGGWPSNNYVAGQRLIGVCYGTYTV